MQDGRTPAQQGEPVLVWHGDMAKMTSALAAESGIVVPAADAHQGGGFKSVWYRPLSVRKDVSRCGGPST